MKNIKFILLAVAGLIHLSVFASEQNDFGSKDTPKLLTITVEQMKDFLSGNFKTPNSCVWSKDYVSFEKIEKNIREKYQTLNIPPIELIENLPAKYGISMAGYHPKEHKIMIDRSNLSDLDAASWEWLTLHESGHAQMPYVVPSIQAALLIQKPATLYFWGMHKSKPYKNIVTKLGSKSLATLAVSAFINCNAMRTEERRADSFANKHADEQALNGGIEAFTNHKDQQEKIWKEIGATSLMSFNMFNNLTDPIHPSIESRIANMKIALKNRFGVEA